MKKTWASSEICEKNWWICYRLRMRGCLCEICKREVGNLRNFFFEILSDLNQAVPNHLTDESQTR